CGFQIWTQPGRYVATTARCTIVHADSIIARAQQAKTSHLETRRPVEAQHAQARLPLERQGSHASFCQQCRLLAKCASYSSAHAAMEGGGAPETCLVRAITP